jgi:uncharacterized membrane protein
MIEAIPFQSSAISPVACLQTAWQRIKDDYWLFLGITLVGILIGSAVPFGILMGPMMCGMAKCYLDKGRGQTIRFEMLFKGFDHFKEALIASLILFGISLAATLPFVFIFVFATMFAAFGAATNHFAPSILTAILLGCGGLILMILLSLLVGACFAFTYPLIEDRKLTGVEAIRHSFKAALGNWGGLIGLSLLSFLLSLVGMCCCYVGIFFILPITMGAHTIAYEQVFGRAEEIPDQPIV